MMSLGISPYIAYYYGVLKRLPELSCSVSPFPFSYNITFSLIPLFFL